jgi:hypothetical protein
VHAVRPAGERNIEAIVYHNPRARRAHGIDTCFHEADQGTRLEVTLPDLHEMHACMSRRADQGNERPFRASQATPVRYETDDGRHQGRTGCKVLAS